MTFRRLILHRFLSGRRVSIRFARLLRMTAGGCLFVILYSFPAFDGIPSSFVVILLSVFISPEKSG